MGLVILACTIKYIYYIKIPKYGSMGHQFMFICWLLPCKSSGNISTYILDWIEV